MLTGIVIFRNVIIHHHKIFYQIRHQLAPLILATLQRNSAVHSPTENRRLTIDVCEMFIKWEEERQQNVAVSIIYLEFFFT